MEKNPGENTGWQSLSKEASPKDAAQRISKLLLACVEGLCLIVPENHPLCPQLRGLSEVLQKIIPEKMEEVPQLASELKAYFQDKKTEKECWILEKEELKNVVLSLVQILKELAASSGGFDQSLDDRIKKIQTIGGIEDILVLKDQIVSEAGKIQEGIKSIKGELEKHKNAVWKLSQRLEQSEANALVDPLTRVFNRTAYNLKMRQMIKEYQRHGEPAVVIVVDIDFFKRFNDTCGHKAGDKILNSVAMVIHETIRAADQVFRYGGEEFVLLLNRIDLQNAKNLAEKVRHNVANTYVSFEGQKLRVTISLGVTCFKKDDTEATLFQRADSAMYQAKSNGRNRSEVVL